VEGLAWHQAQLGYLSLQLGEYDPAARAFAHAEYLFPGHPFALDGRVRVAAALGDHETALRMLVDGRPMPDSPDEAALRGDLLIALGRMDEAEGQYRLAELAWETDQADPVRLAGFRRERGR
jgi:tetratricopeptide (TPR) repeat protein